MSFPKKYKKIIFPFLLIIIGSAAISFAGFRYHQQLTESKNPVALTPKDLASQYQEVLPPTVDLEASDSAKKASSSAKPTPSPQLSFAEMNDQYGPCTVLPTLMYHHVEDLDKAKAEGHAQLTVGTSYFRKQMEYLRDKKYNVLSMQDLINFFDSGTPLPKKPILLTFDDGYEDFGTDAWPILKEMNFHGTMFLPTGLVENPGYLKWSKIKEIADQNLVLMSNHTWSHHNMGASKSVIEKEISTAQGQLLAHHLDSPEVFAYPYGLTSPYSESYLNQKKYLLAFTTVHGSTLCKQQRLILPRIRIGNAQLNSYGL